MYRIGEDLDALASHPLSAPDTPRRPESRSISRQVSMTRLDEKQCRICFEGATAALPLISPCSCAGSVKFVHEECLKTWIMSQQNELADSECEVCKLKFDMNFVIKATCAPKVACKTGFAQVLFLPLLFVVLSMLMLIIYILFDRLANVVSSDEEKGYTSALIVVCLLSAAVIVLLIVNSIKEAMCIKKMVNWRIRSQRVAVEIHRASEIQVKEEDSMQAIVNTTHFVDAAKAPETSSANQIERPSPFVVVVPEITRVRGQKVVTPKVSPGLSSVQSANHRVQAFMMGSRSVSSCGTPLQPNFSSTPPYVSARATEAFRNLDYSEQQSFREDY